MRFLQSFLNWVRRRCYWKLIYPRLLVSGMLKKGVLGHYWIGRPLRVRVKCSFPSSLLVKKLSEEDGKGVKMYLYVKKPDHAISDGLISELRANYTELEFKPSASGSNISVCRKVILRLNLNTNSTQPAVCVNISVVGLDSLLKMLSDLRIHIWSSTHASAHN